MTRKIDASVQTVKHLGHGRCDLSSASESYRQLQNASSDNIYKTVRQLFRKLRAQSGRPVEDLRGVGFTIEGLSAEVVSDAPHAVQMMLYFPAQATVAAAAGATAKKRSKYDDYDDDDDEDVDVDVDVDVDSHHVDYVIGRAPVHKAAKKAKKSNQITMTQFHRHGQSASLGISVNEFEQCLRQQQLFDERKLDGVDAASKTKPTMKAVVPATAVPRVSLSVQPGGRDWTVERIVAFPSADFGFCQAVSSFLREKIAYLDELGSHRNSTDFKNVHDELEDASSRLIEVSRLDRVKYLVVALLKSKVTSLMESDWSDLKFDVVESVQSLVQQHTGFRFDLL
jgi:hypothetical protein